MRLGWERGAGLLMSWVVLCAVFAFVPATFADPITGLNFNVEYGGFSLGEVRLHVGTHDFSTTGRDGIGKATPGGEKSGYYTGTGLNLAAAAGLAGFDHINWLQIVTSQPAAHNDPFGLPPHADPSDDPDNMTPRDLEPWYLNETIPTNPPFDLPPGTATLLEFQDFPTASPWNLGETFSADAYLVGILDVFERTYTTMASFSWTLTQNLVDNVTRVRMTELRVNDTALPAAFQDVVAAYAQRGWTYVPEPTGAVLFILTAVLLKRRAAC